MELGKSAVPGGGPPLTRLIGKEGLSIDTPFKNSKIGGHQKIANHFAAPFFESWHSKCII